MGKGSNRRPKDIDYVQFCKNWDKIFGKGSAPDPGTMSRSGAGAMEAEDQGDALPADRAKAG